MKIIKSDLLRFLPDKLYLKLKYRIFFKKKLNFKNPQTFNEKLNWLKLNDRNEKYSLMVDKYEAKKIISEELGKEYVIPTLGVYNEYSEIKFDELPDKFVIKCTHDSGGLVICKDKSEFDFNGSKKIIENSLKRNYYFHGREWPYKNVKPRIIVEKYMEDETTKELRDYKFFCFNGKVKFFKIDFNRTICHQANYYDRNGKLLKFGEIICPPDFDKELDLPVNLKKMIEFAEKLAAEIPFIRIDFYEMNKKIYFGEFTFYPASGFGKFIPNEYDYEIGKLLNINKE